jgi:hypothetical protein
MHNPALRARSLVALVVALAALAAWSPQASADTPASSGRDACNYDGWSFYACLHFDYKGYGWYNASTVLHRNMSTDYARALIACGGYFKASLWGRDEDNDHSQDDFIRNLVLTPGYPQASYNGLDVRFYTVDIADSQLDEDDGTDELFVRMTYRDCNSGLVTQTYDTDDMVGNFG